MCMNSASWSYDERESIEYLIDHTSQLTTQLQSPHLRSFTHTKMKPSPSLTVASPHKPLYSSCDGRAKVSPLASRHSPDGPL